MDKYDSKSEPRTTEAPPYPPGVLCPGTLSLPAATGTVDFTGRFQTGFTGQDPRDARLHRTAQNSRELWGSTEGLCILNFNKQRMNQWI